MKIENWTGKSSSPSQRICSSSIMTHLAKYVRECAFRFRPTQRKSITKSGGGDGGASPQNAAKSSSMNATCDVMAAVAALVLSRDTAEADDSGESQSDGRERDRGIVINWFSENVDWSELLLQLLHLCLLVLIFVGNSPTFDSIRCCLQCKIVFKYAHMIMLILCCDMSVYVRQWYIIIGKAVKSKLNQASWITPVLHSGWSGWAMHEMPSALITNWVTGCMHSPGCISNLSVPIKCHPCPSSATASYPDV